MRFTAAPAGSSERSRRSASSSCTCRSSSSRCCRSTRHGRSRGRRRDSPRPGGKGLGLRRTYGRASRTRPRPRWLRHCVALVLGTLASFAVQRYKFFGRETLSFLVILPIALPGHRDRHRAQPGVPLARRTDGVPHAGRRPRDVLHRHRLQQRRRAATSPVAEPRRSVGRPRRRHVADVSLRHVPDVALGAARRRRCWRSPSASTRSSSRPSRPGPGFQTLPLWIFSNMFRPNNLPLVNVVATAVVVAVDHSRLARATAHRLRLTTTRRSPNRSSSLAWVHLAVLGFPGPDRNAAGSGAHAPPGRSSRPRP